MKWIIGIIVIILIALGGWYVLGDTAEPTNSDSEDSERAAAEGSVPEPGTYEVVAEESTLRWAAGKPLIEGYINSGSIAISEGVVTVENESASGVFTIDMNTISVGATPTKPGQENTLESHLKGERWFDVATYPVAEFSIISVAPITSTENRYTVNGMLTMKDQTHEVSFPASIYADGDGRLHADAEFEIDRTRWGVTSGSSSFFDNLADNVIEDEIRLTLKLVAQQERE